jgi:small subunit ribosomal protein S1
MSPEQQKQAPHPSTMDASASAAAAPAKAHSFAESSTEDSQQPSMTATDAPASEPIEASPQASAESLAPESEKEGAAAVTETAESSESTEQMDKLIDQYSVPQEGPAEGETIDGRVIAVTELGVMVDFGAKSEGLVPAQEFVELGGIPFEPGQAIEVERLHQQKEGYVLLSHIRARRRKVWENIEKSYREHVTLTGKVLDRIKGGLVVDIGLRAFLPASQLDLRPVRDLEAWKDNAIPVRVLKVNRKRGNVVVSRRVILEEEQKSQREALMASISEGTVVQGKVKNITDYGVFVDLGGLDGLLHISDLVWGRVAHPSEVVSAGQEIEVKVLKFDREKMRISLGRKQLLPDPWASVPERFPVGTRVRGRVVGVTDYGAFVQIEPGVEGLVHVSEMSWSKRIKHPSKIVNVGDEVEVAVLEVKSDQRRISLGLKQTLPDPWQEVAMKFPTGSIITGRVRNLADFGAFVEIEEGIEGLIHVSDMSWTERVKHPSEKFKKGDTIEAKVLKVDAEHRRLSLGVKQVNDIWGKWFEAHRLNEVVRGKVARAADFGLFVELAEGIEGLCHVSEIEERRPKGQQQERPNKAATKLELGQEYDFKIIRLDPDQHKISLSYRAAQKQVERREMEDYRSSKSSPTATIGDAIMAKRESS